MLLHMVEENIPHVEQIFKDKHQDRLTSIFKILFGENEWQSYLQKLLK